MIFKKYIPSFIVFGILISFHANANANANESLPLILTHTFNYKPSTPISVEPEDLLPGCPKKDCIRSIDNPYFNSINDTHYMSDDDELLVAEYNGLIKAYPKKIMNFREIVNDNFDGYPVLVTYCPLAYTGVAYLSELDGETVRFGVSGLLHNSSLVMYDRHTNQLWSQVLGEVIVGSDVGKKLKPIQMRHISWKDLVKHYPKALILAPEMRDSATMKEYPSGTAYGDYDTNEKILYPVVKENPVLHRKAKVYGAIVNNTAIAVTEDILNDIGEKNININGLSISRNIDGGFSAYDKADNNIPLLHAFWFTWYAFHPETKLYNKN